MSKSKQETIADIVAEVRARAKAWPDPSLVQYDERLADRIEAAAKREREDGAEAAQICGEIGEMVGREAACDKSSQVGNAAAIREACENIAEYAKTAACHIEDIDDAHLIGYLNQIERWAEAAIAEPQRNCDKFNTADEAYAGFRKFCDVTECSECQFDKNTTTCLLSWLFAEAKGETHEQK